MPDRLPKLIHALRDARTPLKVLDALDDAVGPLHVLSVWYVPNGNSLEGGEIIYHHDISKNFRSDHANALASFGISPARQLSATASLPFTVSEARRILNPVGRDAWVFDLLQDHRMRDGLVVHHGRYVVAYYSDKPLNDKNLSPELRMALELAADAVAYRLNELAVPKRRRKRIRVVELTDRELAVLSHLARGLNVPQIARHLQLKEPTVRTFLNRAKVKLKAANSTHATVIAIKRKLIRF